MVRRGARHAICDDILDVISTHSSTKTHKLNLHWRWLQREHFVSGTFGVTIEIKKAVNAMALDERCYGHIRHSYHVVKVIHTIYNLSTPMRISRIILQ